MGNIDKGSCISYGYLVFITRKKLVEESKKTNYGAAKSFKGFDLLYDYIVLRKNNLLNEKFSELTKAISNAEFITAIKIFDDLNLLYYNSN